MPEDRLVAARNKAKTCRNLAALYKTDLRRTLYYATEIEEVARYFGGNDVVLNNMLLEALHQIVLKHGHVHKIYDLCPSGSERAELCMAIVGHFYRQSLKFNAEEPPFRALSILDECSRPLVFAREENGDPALIAELEEDIAGRRLEVECARHWVLGALDVNRSMHDFEELCMDTLCAGIDHLRLALRPCCAPRHEGRAALLLGTVYMKVFHNRARAKEYLANGFALLTRNSSAQDISTPWYTEARDLYESIRKAEQVEEEEVLRKNNQWKKDIKEALKPKLEELVRLADDCSKTSGVMELLRHVYEVHPCKGVKEPPTEGEAKKLLLTAIAHYHPDKHVLASKENQVLYEEITRILNNAYSRVYKDEL